MLSDVYLVPDTVVHARATGIDEIYTLTAFNGLTHQWSRKTRSSNSTIIYSGQEAEKFGTVEYNLI